MFSFKKSLDVLTLFHSPSNPASQRVLSALKAANTAAEESPEKKAKFELDVIEGPMTPSQLRSILDYVGDSKVSDVVEGVSGVKDAMKVIEDGNAGRLKRPIVVDWNNGKVVFGGGESAIKSLVDSLPKS